MIKVFYKHKLLYIQILLSVVNFIVYLGVLNNSFINYDDNEYLTENQHVQTSVNWTSIKWAFSTNRTGYWHPVTWLSIMFDYQLYGLRPWGYHLTNLILHIVNVLLLFEILRNTTGAMWRSAFVAAVFALHPLNVESVAWLAERKNVLSTLFWLLTIAGYTQYAKSKSINWYISTLLLFAVGLMAKPIVVMVPVTFLLLDYWPLRRFGGILTGKKKFLKLVVEKIPFFVLSLISSVVTFIGQKSVGTVAKLDVLPLSSRLSNAIISYGKYIIKMFWPNELSVIYPLNPGDLKVSQFIAAIILLSAISLLIMVLSKKHRYLSMGWLWYIVTLFPVIGLVQVGEQSMADRYTYVPAIGLFIMAAWGIGELSMKLQYQRFVLSFVSAVIMSCLSVMTAVQLRYWCNSITLFEHAIKVTKDNYVAYYSLSDAYRKTGNYAAAIQAGKESIKLRPNYSKAHSNLGAAYNETGRYKEAAEECELAIKLEPMNENAYCNLGLAYVGLGDLDEAIKALEKAISIKPSVESYSNLGAAYGKLRKYDKAIEACQQAIIIQPNNAESYCNLGVCYGGAGQYEKEIEAYKKAIDIKPSLSEAWCNLGNAYAKASRYVEAIEAFKRAVKIKPAFVEVHFNLGMAYVRIGKKEAAMEEYKILKGLNLGLANRLLADINNK